jgi:hypothetical protein
MTKQTIYLSSAAVFMLGVIASCVAGDIGALSITLTGVLGSLVMNSLDN